MTGRTHQLGRQLRKLRHIVGGQPSADPMTTLRRATQLARDLACEHAEADDAGAAFEALAARGLLERALADRLAAWIVSHATDGLGTGSQRDDAFAELAMRTGRDLDRFLRSVELGAPAPEIPFDAIISSEPAGSAKPDSTAAVTVSGRVLVVEERGGRAVVTLDERPLAMSLASGERVTSFALAAAPTSRAEVQREPTGATRVVWGPEHVALELATDLASVRVDTRSLASS